jgi:choice-of-anchor C domain-containing protein
MTLKRKIRAFALTALLALAIGNVQAAFFVNGSFESATVDPASNPIGFVGLNAGDKSITGWVVERDDIDYIGAYWQAANGVRSIDLDGLHPGSISQTFDTAIGSTYRVGFDLAGNPDGPPSIKRLRVSAGNEAAIFQFDVDGHSRDRMGYEHHFFVFEATSSQSTLAFSSLTDPNAPLPAFGPALDNVTVSPAIPEPGLSVFVLSGILMLAAKRRLMV